MKVSILSFIVPFACVMHSLIIFFSLSLFKSYLNYSICKFSFRQMAIRKRVHFYVAVNKYIDDILIVI